MSLACPDAVPVGMHHRQIPSVLAPVTLGEFWHLAHARARKKASKSAIFARVGISLVTLTHWFSLIPIS